MMDEEPARIGKGEMFRPQLRRILRHQRIVPEQRRSLQLIYTGQGEQSRGTGSALLMSTQLDILALEPFFGGARKAMLETIMRHSRHRWTLLKLPPRRIERRLAVAAHWFGEQLTRHWKGRLDV